MSPESGVRSPVLRYGQLHLLAGMVLLTTLTAPLWWGGADLPGIPWLSLLVGVPLWVDRGLMVATVGLIGAAILTPSHRRLLLAGGAVTWGGLLLLDQLRLQPWAWQFWMLLMTWAVLQEQDVPRVWRWLVVSIYFWSAISKLDRGFLDSHGQLLLEGLVGSLGGTTKFWDLPSRQAGALLMPVTELSAALFLMFRRTRCWGWVVSLVMHGGLLLALGNQGLGHEWGVLAWNVWFIIQNLLLWRSDSPGEKRTGVSASVWIAIVFGFPAFQAIGWCDHWPAWEVYCARPEQVRWLVTPEQIPLLPKSLQKVVSAPEPLSDLSPVSLESWGFQQVHAPLYPQERYKLALIGSLLSGEDQLRTQFVVEVRSSPNRLTGERKSTIYASREALEERLGDFLVNTRPRVHDRGN